ncbi:hypothetical protein LSCM1_01346 [Leishmania martiniquensis]|uniref:Calpain catalytic domain-containing protein n=1 Tax=Leishmania martiniquensis TaxID=1580590 RepID=A0A836GWX4_9TRYP|nr:hypothetical protein LSCM1_01346 [Leishmania martiniquensis]
MGCCNSKNTKEPKGAGRPPLDVQPAEEDVKQKTDEVRDSTESSAEEETPGGQSTEADAKAAQELADPRAARIQAICARNKGCPYRYGACTVVGGDVKCYFEDGLIYCIVKDGCWHIYNDTLDYEAQVELLFGPGSQIATCERTMMEVMENNWTRAYAAVYPLETVQCVSGKVCGYQCSITIKPLDDSYRLKACAAANRNAEMETETVRRLAGNLTDEDEILRRCVETNTPYVDLTFPPCAAALARAGRDSRSFPVMAMMRPTQYLPEDMCAMVNDVIGAVVPHSIEHGSLGDSWLMCALAILAEDETAIHNLLMQGTPAEKAVGAYRLLMNKNGWWITVLLDDYLPTFSRTPVFARVCDNPAEMWVSLLQKAYAKVHGSYAAITGGDALQALADFAGSLMYRFDKEWEVAALDVTKAEELADALVGLSRSGASVVLSTPGHTSESYLGCNQESDPEGFRARYTKCGLRTGYTYFVERVVTLQKQQTLLFKLRNPWRSSGQWNGAWSYGSAEWGENPDVCSVCDAQEDPQDGSFWICWKDACEYFDGGGVFYPTSAAEDYRVKGFFDGTIPTVILEIMAVENTRVLLTLSQPDKRGVDLTDGAARFAPIMLTVSKKEGDMQRVQKNTSWNPEMPSNECNFVVGRDVGMWFTLEAGEVYHVVPRMHCKGVKSQYHRPYVVGILSYAPLEGKVRAQAMCIESDSNVFTNYSLYRSGAPQPVQAEHQTRLPGKAPVTNVSTTVI